MIRTFNLPWSKLAPGTVALSEQADQEWPKLFSAAVSILQANGIKIEPNDIVAETPPEHAPRKTVAETQAELQEPYNQIMARHGFDYIGGARAGVVACTMIIVRHQDVLNPRIACGIAAMGFIEGTKTVPPPLPTARS